MESARTPPSTPNESHEPVSLFIIRFWFDEDSRPGGPRPVPRRWRGIITHPPSLSRHPVTSLSQITSYLDMHLRELGAVSPGWLARVCRQLWPDHWH